MASLRRRPLRLLHRSASSSSSSSSSGLGGDDTRGLATPATDSEGEEDLDHTFSSEEIDWLQQNLPIIVQPEVDVEHGHGLVGVFAEFNDDEDDVGARRCDLRLMYHGEASWERHRPTRINTVGTFLYRSFNYLSFDRTADINQLTYRGVRHGEDVEAYSRIQTEDFNGEQSWSQGLKGDFFRYFSLMYHYDLDLPFSMWQRDVRFESSRPLLFVNTNNHMHGDRDANPQLRKLVWFHYPIWKGDADVAEHYARNRVPIKANLLTCFPLCCCFRHRHRHRHRRTQQRLLHRLHTPLWARDGVQDTMRLPARSL